MKDITLDGGKYTLRRHDDGRMEALRYGEPWRDLVGDNLIYWLACEIDTLRNALMKACGDDAEMVNQIVESQR